jgi:hypothetical protein
MEEARARQQAEDETRQLEAEAKRRAHEEERQRQAEAEARQRADEERSRREAEAKRRADEAESRRRAEAQARQRADEERRRQEAEAKRVAEQEEAFAAAKRADDVSAFDAFLANHRESRYAAEARTLREALLARDEGCKAAMASDDPAVLKAFLRKYPKGAPAEQVRGRLRSLEPQTAFDRRRKVVAAVLLLVLFVGAVAGLRLYTVQDDPSCADARKLADNKLTDFTLVTDVAILPASLPKESSPFPESSRSLLKDVNDCAASCRTRPWCKAFRGFDGRDCVMYEDFQTYPYRDQLNEWEEGRCNWNYYWFKRK